MKLKPIENPKTFQPKPSELEKAVRLPKLAHPFEHRSVYLQRVQDYVRNDYYHYITGVSSADKWPALVTKFQGLYAIDRDKKQRYRCKQQGIGNAVLLAHQPDRKNVIHWILLVSDGIHPAHQHEKMKNTYEKSERITFEWAGYELIRIEGCWSWRMTAEHKEFWEKRIVKAAAHTVLSDAMRMARQIIYSLSRVPGFKGTRRDAFALRGSLIKEWRKKKGLKAMKYLPPRPWPRIGYIGRLSDK